MAKPKKIVSPKGELCYMFINEEGRPGINEKSCNVYSATLRLPNGDPLIAEFEAVIEEYWKLSRPSDIKHFKSNGVRKETKKNDEGEKIETGFTNIGFWTYVEWVDKKTKEVTPKVVNVYDSKGKLCEMGDHVIGNGSTGRISGFMQIYVIEKTREAGVTLYLNNVQLLDFKEYIRESGFGDEEIGGTFEGFAKEDFKAAEFTESDNKDEISDKDIPF